MDVREYMDAYVFLYTFSKVYYCAAIINGTLKDYVPLLSLDYLYNEFAAVYKLKIDKAKKLIDCFVFDKDIAKKKIYGDVFTRPLISAGSKMVLLSEGLIDQINLDRNIEVLLEWNNVNLASVGKELELKLIEELKNVDNLIVNSSTIDFMAYDGKNVEFDFIALLDDYLILIEMKSVLQPYDDDELSRRQKTISEGVDQVNRRVKIIQKDWDKIKEKANIKLPDEPYDEEHIIKIVCTDIGNFTGLEMYGVILTDDATIIKYFKNPYVHGIETSQVNYIKMFRKQVLWKEGQPTAKEFILYLHNPDTMDCFIDCLEQEWKLIPMFKGYKPIAFQDVIVKDDPLKKLAEKHHF